MSYFTSSIITVIVYLTVVIVTNGSHFDSARFMANKVREVRDLEISSNDDFGLCETHDVSKHNKDIRQALRRIEILARNKSLLNSTYRHPAGLYNNKENPRWGASFSFQNRLLPNSYSDGRGLPRVNGKSGRPLPSARTVSTKCFLESKEEKNFLDEDSTMLLFQTGQLLDHEIISTSLASASGCCAMGTMEDLSAETPCFPITIEPEDRFFKGNCMNFRRAYGAIVKGEREQVNTVTPLIDLSTVYGSDENQLSELRLYQKGFLKVSKDNMFPTKHCFTCVKENSTECPFAGDSRVSEMIGLSALHLILLREHNRLAKKLAAVNPHWNDERLFQEARKINTAEFQHFVYEEFLPKVIGAETVRKMGINSPHLYDREVNPGVLNEFGCAAFRFGHTLVNSIQYISKNHFELMSDLFFNSCVILHKGETVIKDVLANQARRNSQKFDSFFTTEFSDKLYKGVPSEAEPGETFDLLARNLQRGRDQGLRPYIDYLDFALQKLKGLTTIRELQVPKCLRTGIYQSVDDTDVFTGGVAETPLRDAIVGPTFAAIIGQQFYNLKFGDRFFYETPDSVIGFTSVRKCHPEKHESGAQKRKNRDKLAYENKRMAGAMDRFTLPSTSFPSRSDSSAPPATDNTQGDHDADGSNTQQEVNGCKENSQQVVEVTKFSTTEENAQGSDEQLRNIKSTSLLSAIICRNTVVKTIQPRSLDSRRTKGNGERPCSSYSDLKFKLWEERL